MPVIFFSITIVYFLTYSKPIRLFCIILFVLARHIYFKSDLNMQRTNDTELYVIIVYENVSYNFEINVVYESVSI